MELKKKNDFSNLYISKALKFIKKKYKNVEFDPIWTNFHYAGPREAFPCSTATWCSQGNR